MADVFISYSRKDKTFTEQLFSALATNGRDAWVDWEGIAYSVDWWHEICAGIDAADTFLFIISPDSLASMVCNQEIAYARENHKRIIPVIHRPVEEKMLAGEWFGKDWEVIARDNWTEIKRLNWLFFREEDNFDQAFAELLRTAEADPEHLKFHTRLLVRAREWETRVKRDDGLLLRGEDLRQAENWLMFNTSKQPQPTSLHEAYIRESLNIRAQEEAAERRQRERLRLLVAALSILLIVAVGASLLAVNRSQLADTNAETAVGNAEVAVANANTATVAQGRAEENAATATVALGEAAINLKQAWDTQSQFLADLSRQQLEADFQDTALLLALESLAHYPEVNHDEAANALVNALRYPGQIDAQMEHQGYIGGAIYSADETRILSWSMDGIARVWDAQTGEPLRTLSHAAGVSNAIWTYDESHILTHTGSTVQIWDSVGTDAVPRLVLRHEDDLGEARFSANESRIFTRAGNFFSVWDAETGERFIQLEHEARVYGLRTNRDETRLLTWTYDGTQNPHTLYLWDISSGVSAEQLLELPHDGAISDVAWNAAEDRFMTWSLGGTITVWDAQTGDALLTLSDQGAVNLAKWNLDETQIVSVSVNSAELTGLLTVWDASTGEMLFAVPHEVNAWSAEWNHDETRILSWSSDAGGQAGYVTVWDAASGNLILRLSHTDFVFGARWNADESRILSWSEDGTARVWDMAGQPLFTFRHPYKVYDATWNVDETQVLTRSSDSNSKVGKVTIWNMAGVDTTFSARGHTQLVAGAAWNHDETRILSASEDGTARVWDVATGAELLRLTQSAGIRSAVWNHDETRILTSSEDGHARVWDAETGEELLTLPHGTRTFGAGWNADSTRIISWAGDATAIVWDSLTGEAILTLPHSGAVWGGLWNRDQSQILTWGSGGEAILWDAENGERLHAFSLEISVYGAAWSPDETSIVTWSMGGSGSSANVIVWDSTTYEQRYTLPHPSFNYAAWINDGVNLMTWSSATPGGFEDGFVTIWDAATGEPLRVMEDPYAIRGAEWGVRSNRLLTWTQDAATTEAAVKVWDAATGEMLMTLPRSSLRGATWNADETKVLAWGYDGAVWVWPVELSTWIEMGNSRVRHPFTDEERARFFLPSLTATPSE